MATFATSTGLRESSQNSPGQLRDNMVSETNTDVHSPRGSREVTYSMPKKTVHYSNYTGSKEALQQRLKLMSPNESSEKASIPPFKNGTQLSFKGEPLQSPLNQSDKNTNFQSQTSMPRNDEANTNPSDGGANPALMNSFTGEVSMRRNSIGLESKE